MSFIYGNDFLSRLIQKIRLSQVQMLIIDTNDSLTILWNRMWFSHYLDLLFLFITRSPYLRQSIRLYLGNSVRISIAFVYIFLCLIIWAWIWKDIIRLTLIYCLHITLWFFFNCHFPTRLMLYFVAHQKIIFSTCVLSQRFILLQIRWITWAVMFWCILALICTVIHFFGRKMSFCHDLLPFRLFIYFSLFYVLWCWVFFGIIELRFAVIWIFSSVFLPILRFSECGWRFSLLRRVRILMFFFFITLFVFA